MVEYRAHSRLWNSGKVLVCLAFCPPDIAGARRNTSKFSLTKTPRKDKPDAGRTMRFSKSRRAFELSPVLLVVSAVLWDPKKSQSRGVETEV